MGAITNKKSKIKQVASKADGYLEAKDLHAEIRKLVPSAPPGAKINIYVNVPSGGDYSGMPLNIDKDVNIEFTVTWEENE